MYRVCKPTSLTLHQGLNNSTLLSGRSSGKLLPLTKDGVGYNTEVHGCCDIRAHNGLLGEVGTEESVRGVVPAAAPNRLQHKGEEITSSLFHSCFHSSSFLTFMPR